MIDEAGAQVASEIAIAVTTKAPQLTADVIAAAIRAALWAINHPRHGEQSLKQLTRQGKELSSTQLSSNADAQALVRYLDKNGVDCAVEEIQVAVKDENGNPVKDENGDTKTVPAYKIYFKSIDLEQANSGMTKVLGDYEKDKEKTPVKETVKNAVEKSEEKAQEHDEKQQSKETDKSKETPDRNRERAAER